jgi:hypothetical protein
LSASAPGSILNWFKEKLLIWGLFPFGGTTPASNSIVIYLDESGDLGWKFDAPYRRGGSSRHLTITAVCVPVEKKHIPKRVVRELYQKFKWDTSKERKWSEMSADERTAFAEAVRDMCKGFPDIVLHAIVVKKQNVLAHIRTDANKLYNYMIRLALIKKMARHDVVTMVPDPRSIKVSSGNSLHDYLQTVLWFDEKATTNLITAPSDSAKSLGVQFADMLAGLVQSRFEDNAAQDYQLAASAIQTSRLFF